MPKSKRSPTRLGLILAGGYIVLASLYLVISTLLVANAFHEDSGMAEVELAKGLIFIFITGVFLFLVSRYLMSLIARQYEEIEKQRRSIEVLDRRASSGLLASAIGHDANNLLTAVRMSVDILGRGVDPQRMLSILNTVSESLDELMALNQRLVRGGRADQPGELKPRCLKNESERVIHFLDHDHPVSRLNIECQSKGDCIVPLNRHLYFQVLLNLLTNVARHAGEGSRVLIRITELADTVCVTVEDDGPGVPASERESIFAPYYSQHPEGAGLGLASARAAMHLHDGEIVCLASNLGGAKFEMTFPKKCSSEGE
ncbi:sensor histidine kinase [Cerasicoccus frondis]|uniref:sensor histidine kinase n=1 Tax=Cerasicoccus frondis TaxID=490090 RepID=UPI002852CA77|nr:HAMP domain-containing sensor histidine kinase [Cerasicoccus frondis]